MSATAFHGVIIAGGQGSRLGGVRKAELLIDGTRMIEHVARRLEGAASPLLVATGPDRGSTIVLGGSMTVTDRLDTYGGPLAGIAAAVAALAERGITDGILVSVAVDTPRLPSDFVDRLTAALGHKAVAVAAWGEDFYPTNAAWRLEAIATLPAMLGTAGSPDSPKRLQSLLGAARVDWAESHAENPFHNVNTMADLIALQRRSRA